MKTMTIDPVCGMAVTESSAGGRSGYKENSYLFCCPRCKSKFDQQPEQYLAAKAQPSLGGCGCGCGPSA